MSLCKQIFDSRVLVWNPKSWWGLRFFTQDHRRQPNLALSLSLICIVPFPIHVRDRVIFKAHLGLICFYLLSGFLCLFLLCMSIFCPPLFFSLCVSPSLLFCYELLASIIAESSCCFWTCNRNSLCRLVVTLAHMHCRRELMKSLCKLW
jgi:hypothetical protein